MRQARQAQDPGTAVTYSGNINLVTSAGIGSASVSNTAPFTIGGNISGAGSLTKFGANTVTLLGTNTYAGGTIITAGTLQLGANGTSGWLPAQPSGVALTNNGTLSFNRSDTNSFNGNITGTGALTQNGNGTTILGGSNDFAGMVSISAGVLYVTNSSALGSGSAVGDIYIVGGNNVGYLELGCNVNITNSIALRQKILANSGVGAQVPSRSNLSGTNTISSLLQLWGGGAEITGASIPARVC